MTECNKFDLKYYINVYDLMMIDTPEPTPGAGDSIINDGEKLPVVGFGW